MGTLDQLKHQVSMLQVECNMLHNMLINMSKGEHSKIFNHVQLINLKCGILKEEETIHQPR